MENPITLNLKNMHIVSYETGNMKKVKENTADKRPICALLLSDKNCRHKVKVLLKNDKAIAVDKYITQRRNIGSITDEHVEVIANVREFRKDCVVVDNVSNIWFDVSVGI